MAYIYHIVTPKGTYVGQASGDYHAPSWSDNDFLKGSGIGDSRLWGHFNNAYAKLPNEGKGKKDSKAEKRLAAVLSQYSLSEIDIRIFTKEENYGLPEEVFKEFANAWFPSGKTVLNRGAQRDAKGEIVRDPETDKPIYVKGNFKELEETFEKIKSFKDKSKLQSFINRNKVRKRELKDEERLDIAEIVHIYYFLTKGESLLNEEMGGQMTGWYYIRTSSLPTTEFRNVYRNMTPKQAKQVFDYFRAETGSALIQIKNAIRETSKHIFQVKNLWHSILEVALTDQSIVQSIINGDARSVVITKLTKLTDSSLANVKEIFTAEMNKALNIIFSEANIQTTTNDWFKNKQTNIIEWDAYLDWFTGYVYNKISTSITNLYMSETKKALEKLHGQTLYLPTAIKNKVTQDVMSALQTSSLNSWKKQSDKWDINILEGTGVNIQHLNKVFKKRKHKATWQTNIPTLENQNVVSEEVKRSYSAILFYYFYTNRANTSVSYIGGLTPQYVGLDNQPYLKRDYQKNNKNTLSTQLKWQYIQGGMRNSSALLKDWTFNFNILIKLAIIREGKKPCPILTPVTNLRTWDKNSVPVTSNYVVDIEYRKKQVEAKVLFSMPTSVWGKIASYQKEPSLSDLINY